jgi:HEAT repeat protein
LKKKVRDLLGSPDWRQGLAEDFSQEPFKNLAHTLIRLLSSPAPEIKWRAAEALALAVSLQAEHDMEPAREVMRRLLWGLNEESGSIIWGAPEALAEIMSRHAPLAGEFVNIYLSFLDQGCNQLEFLPLHRGVVWGLGRMARAWPDLLQERGAPALLRQALQDSDTQVRGLALWGLGRLGDAGDLAKLRALAGDRSSVTIWDQHQLTIFTIGELAGKAISRIQPDPASTPE